MTLKKKHLLDLVLEELGKRVNSFQREIEEERRIARDAPSSRESWSDTTKSQKGHLVDGLQQQLMQANQVFIFLRGLKVEEKEKAEAGALIEVEEGGKRYLWLLVPGAIMALEVDGKTIETVSPGSAVGRSIIGCGEGETVEVKTPGGIRTLKLIQVQ
ncbi:GreA/GreB family elongation factor [bacterium]|nr:GreA/GreB family elongation factor [bacterium]